MDFKSALDFIQGSSKVTLDFIQGYPVSGVCLPLVPAWEHTSPTRTAETTGAAFFGVYPSVVRKNPLQTMI